MTNSKITPEITPELMDDAAKIVMMILKLFKKDQMKIDEVLINDTILKLSVNHYPFDSLNDEQFNTLKFKIMSNMDVDID